MEVERCMSYYNRIGIIGAGLILIAGSLIGCSDSDVAAKPTPIVSSSDQGTKDTDKEDKQEAIPAEIQIKTDKLVLAPGEQTELQVQILDSDLQPLSIPASELLFSSDTPHLVNDKGLILVPEHAEMGSHHTIIVQYGDIQASAEVKVLYDLADTVFINEDSLPIVTNPDNLAVVVNKERGLPQDYVPANLVKPNIPFSFDGESEKKYLQKEAAEALEQLFAKAKEDGIELFGVSGYRSYQTQHAIFHYNVQTQGEEEARQFSAYPGQSEHQTGLSIDVSSRSAGLALEQLFGDTEEGQWLEEHAALFGFIIRYPEGKEHITGYAYEPWHIRYVGTVIARDIIEQDITLEEYFKSAIPVTN